jgi:phosphatidylglycerophosphate synthase
MDQARRELTFLLAVPERRLLRFLAARIPKLIRPNHLTGLGVVGAVGAGTAYGLSSVHPAWLWGAAACLVVQWLGDSLDGTLARVRGIERPRYGYYLDHIVDAFATAAIGVGLGLSPYIDMGVALGLVIVYLVLSINIYLESSVLGVFQLGYSRIGPTEVRIILIGASALLALFPAGFPAFALPLPRIANAAVVVVSVAMVGMLLARVAKNLSVLARQEPQQRR